MHPTAIVIFPVAPALCEAGTRWLPLVDRDDEVAGIVTVGGVVDFHSPGLGVRSGRRRGAAAGEDGGGEEDDGEDDSAGHGRLLSIWGRAGVAQVLR